MERTHLAILLMNNILAWNVRGLNKASKQDEVARFISCHNISLFGLLETKVKRNGLGHLYQNIFQVGALPTTWIGTKEVELY